MEIAALGRLPRAFTHLFGGWGHAGSTFGKRAQLIRTVDKPLGYEVDDQSLPFDTAEHLQKLRRHYNPAVPGEDLGPHHDVDDTGLVLKGEEDHAFGGARTLAHQHQAGHCGAPTSQPLVPVLSAGEDAAGGKLPAEESNGVRL